MNIIIPKVQSWQLHEFLQTLHPETIAEMWMRLCDYHKYDYHPFDWNELENMILVHPEVAGIELVYFESDCNNSRVVAELVEDYLNEWYRDDITDCRRLYFDSGQTNNNYNDDYDDLDDTYLFND